MALLSIDQRLEEMGIVLPEPGVPVANYVTARRAGNLLFLSGHVCRRDGKIATGKLGDTMNADEGYALARVTAIDMLANVRSVLGSLDNVSVIKLVGFVNSSPDFADQPAVVDGASDLLVDVFGAERGKHARSAVGVNALPLGAAVEIEAVFEVG
jgi:enamine deaminase RidA (YjgF/YER057c/UK114 family)